MALQARRRQRGSAGGPGQRVQRPATSRLPHHEERSGISLLGSPSCAVSAGTAVQEVERQPDAWQAAPRASSLPENEPQLLCVSKVAANLLCQQGHQVGQHGLEACRAQKSHGWACARVELKVAGALRWWWVGTPYKAEIRKRQVGTSCSGRSMPSNIRWAELSPGTHLGR